MEGGPEIRIFLFKKIYFLIFFYILDKNRDEKGLRIFTEFF